MIKDTLQRDASVFCEWNSAGARGYLTLIATGLKELTWQCELTGTIGVCLQVDEDATNRKLAK
jgi:hypothetical protein